ncbi:hypothetical protein FIBSPDRAFT_932077 [Athelia psychrophila]|uniref:Uncharacterized protein n=1 Tax=Athelia psychrophila TaxID=1759441 RepID=A0A166JHM5_9AGAM|nr:hypothetical protein FIBSPDRAFT_932077 [Fibularhizoctonia sp. CBS 109695]
MSSSSPSHHSPNCSKNLEAVRTYQMMEIFPNVFSGRPRTAEHDFSGVFVPVYGDSESEFQAGGNVFEFIELSLQMSTKQRFQQYVHPGKPKPAVDSVFAFDALEAYGRNMSKRARGKVGTCVDPETE